jgi:hypothetical protein
VTPYGEAPQRGPINRVQQTQAAPSVRPQAPQGGRGFSLNNLVDAQGNSLVTPRNMPFAQMILQQRQQQGALAQRNAQLESTLAARREVEGMRQEGQDRRAVYGAEAKAELTAATVAAAKQTAQLNNNTRVFGILKGFEETMARVGQAYSEQGQRGEQFRAKLAQDDQALQELTRAAGSAFNAYSSNPDKFTEEYAAQRAAALNAHWLQRYGMFITPSSKTTTEEPRRFLPGTNTVTTKNPPKASYGAPPKGPAAPQAPTADDLIQRRRERKAASPSGN